MSGILVPTDFSDYSKNALHFAIQLARLFKQPLTVFTCFTASPAPGINAPSKSYQADEAAKEEKARLMAKLQSFLHAHGSEMAALGDVELLVTEGLPVKEITGLVEKRGFEFVVMGTKGASGVVGAIFGSTTQKVAELIACHLIAVPLGAEFKGIGKIVYATDFHANDVQIIEYLLKFASRYGAQLKCLHVCSEKDMQKIDGMVLNTLDDHFHLMKDDIGKRVPDFNNKNLTFKLIEGKDAENGLFAHLDAHPADLVAAVPVRSKTFWGKLTHSSFTQKLLLHSKTPMFILKDISLESH